MKLEWQKFIVTVISVLLLVTAVFFISIQLTALVDLGEEKAAALDLSERSPGGPSETNRPLGGFCPSPGSVSRDGWAMEYETTPTDGLRIANVTYQGREVLRSAKLVEWHVDYNGTYVFPGFFDITGCGNLQDPGFHIHPVGQTQIVDLLENSTVVGFEVVQDFRMPNWEVGGACYYRYEQRMRFWQDGRFRIVSGSFGRGCGTSATQPYYRPVVRIDVAVDGDDNDSLFLWDGLQWQLQAEETYRTPYEEAGHGPHNYNADSAMAAVVDAQSGGYFILPSQGQFGGAERGDDPFIYVTRHDPAQGDTDLLVINPVDSYKYNDDHKQGPDLFINGEDVTDTNIVLWYVPQHRTDRVDGTDPPYCWTVLGGTNPSHPCYGGPMFVPFGFDETEEITAGFVVNGNEFGVADTAVFTSTSTIPNNAPAIYTWNFGDGITTTAGITTTHNYYINGVFTPTLTVTSFGLEEKMAVGQPITATAKNVFLPMIINE